MAVKHDPRDARAIAHNAVPGRRASIEVDGLVVPGVSDVAGRVMRDALLEGEEREDVLRRQLAEHRRR